MKNSLLGVRSQENNPKLPALRRWGAVVSPGKACPQGSVRGPRLNGKEFKKYWICWMWKKVPKVSFAEVPHPPPPRPFVCKETEIPHMTLYVRRQESEMDLFSSQNVNVKKCK